MKNLFKPRKKEDSTTYLEKIIPTLKYILIAIVIITVSVMIFGGFNIIFNQTTNSADPMVGFITILASLVVGYLAIIIINIIESLLLGFLIIVENNKKLNNDK